MAGGITGDHAEGDADPAGDANAQDVMLLAHDDAIANLNTRVAFYRDLGAGPTFPIVAPDGSPLQDKDAFDFG
jgi:hypothetical protein